MRRMPLKFIYITAAFIPVMVGTYVLYLLVGHNDHPSMQNISKPAYTIPRQIQYGYSIKNTTNRLIPKAQLWVYGPVYMTATQKSVSIHSSYPHTLISDELGNQVLHFIFENIPPYSTRIVNIQADLLLSPTPNALPFALDDRYLKPEKYIESGHRLIVQQAGKLKKASIMHTINSLFEWVSAHIQYDGYSSRDRGALYALRNRKGDCTDFAYLFAALARAQKIPVRPIGGFVCKNNAVLKASGYHNWSEFMENGIWKIADPQYGILRENPSDYIAMRVMGAQDSPMGRNHRFRSKGKGLKVTMN